MNTFGGSAGNGDGGEPNVPHHRPAQYGGSSGAGRLTLGAYDPNTTRERPFGALSGEYIMFHRGDGRSAAGGMYARGFGANAAQILEGSKSFGQYTALGNYSNGGAQDAYSYPLAG